jgi:hypothetical protein
MRGIATALLGLLRDDGDGADGTCACRSGLSSNTLVTSSCRVCIDIRIEAPGNSIEIRSYTGEINARFR